MVNLFIYLDDKTSVVELLFDLAIVLFFFTLNKVTWCSKILKLWRKTEKKTEVYSSGGKVQTAGVFHNLRGRLRIPLGYPQRNPRQALVRLQNSPYFCVFKYARAVKQKVWSEAENRERDWGEMYQPAFIYLWNTWNYIIMTFSATVIENNL